MSIPALKNFRKVAGINLYRSATPEFLSEDEVDLFARLFGIRTVIDMRPPRKGAKSRPFSRKYPSVCVDKSDKTPERKHELVRYHMVALMRNFHRHLARVLPWETAVFFVVLNVIDALFGTALMLKLGLKYVVAPRGILQQYKDFVDSCGPAFVQAVKLAALPSSAPCMIICRLGKDRTGLTVALCQAVAGMTSDEICKEYARTDVAVIDNIYQQPDMRGIFTTTDLKSANYETMQNLIAYVEAKFGSMLNYLKHHGLSEDKAIEVRKSFLSKPVSSM